MSIIKELIFPRHCPICDSVVKLGSMICNPCKGRLRLISGNKCVKCGKSLGDEDEELCFDCNNKKHYYDRGMALYEYESVNQALYRFKYNGRCEYADYFGVEMAKHLRPYIKEWKPEAIIPVPLYKRKLRIRGFNQAGLLAKSFAKAVNIPYRDDIVVRTINTVPMKELDVRARQINLKKAFIIKDFGVKLSRVIIVDDIYTTGSTIDTIARNLKRAGVKEVYYIALAIGNGL